MKDNGKEIPPTFVIWQKQDGQLVVLCEPDAIADGPGKAFADTVERFNKRMLKKAQKEGNDG